MQTSVQGGLVKTSNDSFALHCEVLTTVLHYVSTASLAPTSPRQGHCLLCALCFAHWTYEYSEIRFKHLGRAGLCSIMLVQVSKTSKQQSGL